MSLTRGLVLDVANQLGGAMPSVVTLHDFSRFGNHGTMTNVTWIQLPTGLWVMEFDGTADVNCGNDASLEIAGDITIELWAQLITSNANVVLLCKGLHATDGWYIQQGANERYSCWWEGPIVRQGCTSLDNLLVIGEWVHVVVRRVGTQGWVFRNGVDFTNTSGVIVDPVSSTRNLYIGSYDGGIQNHNSFITAVRIYSYAFTPAQIRARYHSTRWLFGSAT